MSPHVFRFVHEKQSPYDLTGSWTLEVWSSDEACYFVVATDLMLREHAEAVKHSFWQKAVIDLSVSPN